MDSDAVTRQIQQHVRGWYESSALWPMAQPKSITRGHLNEIFESQRYLVSQKADGVHKALILGTIGEQPYCCFMDRCNKITFHQIECPMGLFRGSLVLGEMMDAGAIGQRPCFLIFDVVAIAGTSFLRESYANRMVEATGLVQAQLTGTFTIGPSLIGDVGPTIAAKPFYAISDFCRSYSPVTQDDGLIFMSATDPISRVQPLKWKPISTVDILVTARREHSQSLWMYEVTEPRIDIRGRAGALCIQTGVDGCVLLATLEKLLAHNGLLQYSVVFECLLQIAEPLHPCLTSLSFAHDIGATMLLIPIKVRSDKLHANSATTVMGTIDSFNANISSEEIASYFRFHVSESTK